MTFVDFGKRLISLHHLDLKVTVGNGRQQNLVVMVFYVLESKNERATKISLQIHGILIPEGLCALHKCDTPACVNPTHLFIGTKRDNIIDAYKKGRRPFIDVGDKNRGSLNGMTNFEENDILEILELSYNGCSNREIADQYGVDASTIWHITTKRTWKHVKRKEGLAL